MTINLIKYTKLNTGDVFSEHRKARIKIMREMTNMESLVCVCDTIFFNEKNLTYDGKQALRFGQEVTSNHLIKDSYNAMLLSSIAIFTPTNTIWKNKYYDTL